MAFQIIRDGSKLSATLRGWAKRFVRVHDDAHVLAVSVICHAAEHGNTTPLNDFFGVLTVNYQTALRNYLMVIFKRHPEAKCLEFTKADGFKMLSDVETQKANLVKLCVDVLINPEGSTFMRFYERDVMKDAILLDDKKFAQMLGQLLAKAKKNDENVKSTVSASLIAALENVHKLAKSSVEAAIH